ncbi:MAG: hypothetical protein Q8L39_14530 [Burkholderiales bacterium]|nr:hypothetical protein [Burkholderiales bacterium]
MATKTLKTIPKISVKIWQPIIDKLDEKLKTACLRRDAYLSKVLEVELDRLDEEVSIPNSQASYDYVFTRIYQLHPKPVSLALPSELTARLNEICSRKRIVRDAFFNRVFLLLAASPKAIDTLLFGDVGSKWRTDVWSENKHDGPFFQNGFYPLEPMIDPFWAIRSGLEMYANDAGLEDYVEPTSGKSIRVTRDIITGAVLPADSLYTTIFEQKVLGNDLLGLSCYLPDWRIPGQGAKQQHDAKLDELLADLGNLP